MIRSAQRGDMTYLLDGMKSLIKHVQKTSQDPYVCNLDQDYERDIEFWFQNLLTSESACILIAQRDRQPAGFIVGVLAEPFVKSSAIKMIGQIELCWVEPAFRRQRVAARLVAELERWFDKTGVEYCDVQYLLGNQEAEATWSRLGYRPYRATGRKRLR